MIRSDMVREDFPVRWLFPSVCGNLIGRTRLLARRLILMSFLFLYVRFCEKAFMFMDGPETKGGGGGGG